jgi:hypothetical protein
MGLLRRPTPGEIVEGGRFSRPYGRTRFARMGENQVAASPPLRHFHPMHSYAYCRTGMAMSLGAGATGQARPNASSAAVKPVQGLTHRLHSSINWTTPRT